MEQLFDFRPCALGDLDKVLGLEAEAMAVLDRPDQLRRNTPAMWAACLQPPHYCLGAWVKSAIAPSVGMDTVLVAVAVLYVPSEGDPEALSPFLQTVEPKGLQAANFKICIVHPEWRGHGLQVTLGEKLHEVARRRGIGLLCATASPHNIPSVRSLEKLGYLPDRTLTKYGFERTLFYRFN